ncbi:MAG TPA: hypothetical protein VEB60_01020 [Candidatus Paceibacterota bacterium]|nr:hypothetical protein [Candidatus Paceibacterota bacterium]
MKLVVNIVIVLLFVTAAYFGVRFALGDKPAEQVGVQIEAVQTATSTNGAARAAAVRTEDFLALLNTAQSINFTSPLLEDETFLGLENFQQPLPTRPVGRINPFAPLNQTDDTPAKAATTTKKTPNR